MLCGCPQLNFQLFCQTPRSMAFTQLGPQRRLIGQFFFNRSDDLSEWKNSSLSKYMDLMGLGQDCVLPLWVCLTPWS